ncbi:hypothetical protein ZIOFF_068962 [Zingiber officinale]|uniref:Uncharacterized protein n=1 Tax=Zingiber officinale TaxID=94328 RepID=A0A8J5C3G8_ZINOF|nr:hypothetical protein ZIOFF_068962 [Zingiber officinale]
MAVGNLKFGEVVDDRDNSLLVMKELWGKANGSCGLCFDVPNAASSISAALDASAGSVWQAASQQPAYLYPDPILAL